MFNGEEYHPLIPGLNAYKKYIYSYADMDRHLHYEISPEDLSRTWVSPSE
jgi:hypothetical protein